MTDPIVRLGNTQLSVEPGDEVRMLVTVRNLAPVAQSFRLDVLGVDAAEWSEITPPEVLVDPEQDATVVVTFSPPAGDRTRNGTYPFAVRAQSVVDADISALAEGDLVIGQVLGTPTQRPAQSKRRATVAAVLILGLIGLIAFVLTLGNRNGAPSISAVPTADPSLTSTPGVGTSGATPTTGASPTTSASPDDLADFQENCEQQFNTQQWHTGNVLYPRSMNLQLGSTTTYDAIVELGDAGIPPKQTIAATDPAAEPVLVQCLISAKLVSVDDDIEVGSDTTELTESDGWYLQTFTPTGTVEWTWAVTAHAPGVHNLQFLLRPAVAYGGSTTGSSTGQQAYFTQITVNASTMENISYWFDTQFTTLGKIIGVLGTAIIGVLTWLVLFSETWGKLRKRTSSEAATEGDSDRQALTRRGEHGRRSGPRTQTARRSPRR